MIRIFAAFLLLCSITFSTHGMLRTASRALRPARVVVGRAITRPFTRSRVPLIPYKQVTQGSIQQQPKSVQQAEDLDNVLVSFADLKLEVVREPKQQIISMLENGNFTPSGIAALSPEEQYAMCNFFRTFTYEKDPEFAQQLHKAFLAQLTEIDPAKMKKRSSRRALKHLQRLQRFALNKELTEEDYRYFQILIRHVFGFKVRPLVLDDGTILLAIDLTVAFCIFAFILESQIRYDRDKKSTELK